MCELKNIEATDALDLVFFCTKIITRMVDPLARMVVISRLLAEHQGHIGVVSVWWF